MVMVLPIAVLAASAVVDISLSAIIFYVAVPWFAVAHPSLRRCLMAAMLLWSLNAVIGVTMILAKLERGGQESGWWDLLLVGLMMGLSVLAINKLFYVSIGKSALVGVLSQLVRAPVAVLIGLAVHFGICSAFTTSTNSMAPTILGPHWTATCPRCGAPAFCSPLSDGDEVPEEGMAMICQRELRSVEISDPSEIISPSDHFVANRLIKPQRWDLIVFQYPEDPTIYYVQRLVGLPGETLVIRDGSVWIDGEKKVPPASVAGLHYENEIKGFYPPAIKWGSPENPATLSLGEYFVLGDFSDRARDSRLWEVGAAGHPAYAVPAENIIGVVTHIYWPPSRWHAFK